jgi:hypothetical protein
MTFQASPLLNNVNSIAARNIFTDLATLAIEAGQKPMSGADRLPCLHRGGLF